MFKIIFKGFFVLLLFTKSIYSQPTQDSISDEPTSNKLKDLLFFDRDSLLNHAQQYIGKPYRYQGMSPEKGFDCSGFVCYNFKKFNIKLPRSSYEQIKCGEKVQKNEAAPGDLIFFKGSDVNSKVAGHVGIIVSCSEKALTFIHSACKGGIRLDSTSSDYYRKRFLAIRRISKNKE